MKSRVKLYAVGNRQPRTQTGRRLLQRTASSACGLIDAPAIDDAEVAERAKVAGDRFGDTG